MDRVGFTSKLNNDCLEFVNSQCSLKRTLKLYGIKKVNGHVYGLIDPRDEETFWLPKCQLCTFHEKWIDKWIQLGGEID